ncbi:hypothetical protein [Bosea sp. ASV33]|uniref:hypothetical protein n=1 Tax=Bosea sp. ASV33 TaxID=2795106 RepID=UPI0032C15103
MMRFSSLLRLRLLLPVLSFGMTLAGAVHAETAPSLLDTVQSRGALQVCTTGDYKPFTLAKDGSFEGIDTSWRNRSPRRSASRPSSSRPNGPIC